MSVQFGKHDTFQWKEKRWKNRESLNHRQFRLQRNSLSSFFHFSFPHSATEESTSNKRGGSFFGEQESEIAGEKELRGREKKLKRKRKGKKKKSNDLWRKKKTVEKEAQNFIFLKTVFLHLSSSSSSLEEMERKRTRKKRI